MNVSNINRPLYESASFCLVAPDPDHDAEIEAGWSHDAARAVSRPPAGTPLSKAQVQKRYEAAQSRERGEILLAVRTRADDRLVGFVRFYWIVWAGYAMLRYAFGDPALHGDGYAQELLQLILRYAFDELGFYRLLAHVVSDETATIRVFRAAGFRQEVRQHLAFQHHGQRWDLLVYGLLADEWRQPVVKSHDDPGAHEARETPTLPDGAGTSARTAHWPDRVYVWSHLTSNVRPQR
ncbi:MAG: GNAT family N-acetyltransferase [Anaerolineae bacterium]|nr:MAG: GNAT family N-acetyltransferase [Anaerolineae bacterium]